MSLSRLGSELGRLLRSVTVALLLPELPRRLVTVPLLLDEGDDDTLSRRVVVVTVGCVVVGRLLDVLLLDELLTLSRRVVVTVGCVAELERPLDELLLTLSRRVVVVVVGREVLVEREL